MPCINPDGTLTESAKTLLKAAHEPMSPEDLAKKIGIPLYKVRSSVREMSEAGLIKETQGRFVITGKGKAFSQGSPV